MTKANIHTTVSSSLLGVLEDTCTPPRGGTVSRLSAADDPAAFALRNGEYVVLETFRTAGGGCHCDDDDPFSS